MKTLIFLLALGLNTSRCTTTDQKTEPQENSIYSKWSLAKLEPGFSPVENFKKGQIVWTLNNNQELNVKILPGTNFSNKLPFGNDGVYDYSINGNEIKFNNVQTYKFDIQNQALVLTTLIGLDANGPRLSFTR